MKVELNASKVKLETLNNFCIENGFEIEIRNRTPYLQVLEVIGS